MSPQNELYLSALENYLRHVARIHACSLLQSRVFHFRKYTPISTCSKRKRTTPTLLKALVNSVCSTYPWMHAITSSWIGCYASSYLTTSALEIPDVAHIFQIYQILEKFGVGNDVFKI